MSLDLDDLERDIIDGEPISQRVAVQLFRELRDAKGEILTLKANFIVAQGEIDRLRKIIAGTWP